MENKLITALLAILLALGGWNLSQTFSLSNQMVLVKEKVNNIEESMEKFSAKKPIKKKKKKKKKKVENE
jgi:hypothetical protein